MNNNGILQVDALFDSSDDEKKEEKNKDGEKAKYGSLRPCRDTVGIVAAQVTVVMVHFFRCRKHKKKKSHRDESADPQESERYGNCVGLR